MKIVDTYITIPELREMSQKMFGQLVKAVVDTEKGVMVVDAEMHSDQEEFLLEHGSEQSNLWGINLHPELSGDEFVEFDSMINLRPAWGNNSRYVENPQIRETIKALVNKLVRR
jgi:hypothetical protein